MRSLESNQRPDLDYILIATPNVVGIGFEAIREELADALSRMNDRWAAELESS